MDIPQFVYLFTSLASALAAILAWVAKIRWSNEYAKAKDEIIKAKEEQIRLLEREIQSLKELTPMKIREYLVSIKQNLEEYNEVLKNERDGANKEIENLNNKITNLENETNEKDKAIKELIETRDNISTVILNLDKLARKYGDLEEDLLQTFNLSDEEFKDLVNHLENYLDGIKSKNIPEDSKQYDDVLSLIGSLLKNDSINFNYINSSISGSAIGSNSKKKKKSPKAAG